MEKFEEMLPLLSELKEIYRKQQKLNYDLSRLNKREKAIYKGLSAIPIKETAFWTQVNKFLTGE